jgi:hypothetical protein
MYPSATARNQAFAILVTAYNFSNSAMSAGNLQKTVTLFLKYHIYTEEQG